MIISSWPSYWPKYGLSNQTIDYQKRKKIAKQNPTGPKLFPRKETTPETSYKKETSGETQRSVVAWAQRCSLVRCFTAGKSIAAKCGKLQQIDTCSISWLISGKLEICNRHPILKSHPLRTRSQFVINS